MLRRLLVFADSRQDTAFQAGYLRGRARALRVRRLITEVVRDREREGRPPASFNSLVEDVFRRGRGSGLYEDPAGADARQRALRVCEWDVLGEIASDERRPPTLERLGLITIGYPGLEQLSREDLDPLLAHTGPDEQRPAGCWPASSTWPGPGAASLTSCCAPGWKPRPKPSSPTPAPRSGSARRSPGWVTPP